MSRHCLNQRGKGGTTMAEHSLHEEFNGTSPHARLQWHCEPARWSVEAPRHCLRIEPDSGTDFRQRTHYGFEADSGHLLFTQVAGDFVLATKVRFHPVHQYDQAGSMVRVSPSCWLK